MLKYAGKKITIIKAMVKYDFDYKVYWERIGVILIRTMSLLWSCLIPQFVLRFSIASLTLLTLFCRKLMNTSKSTINPYFSISHEFIGFILNLISKIYNYVRGEEQNIYSTMRVLNNYLSLISFDLLFTLIIGYFL